MTMRGRCRVILAVAVIASGLGKVSFAQGGAPVSYAAFPQIAVGGGWSCDFFVTNQGFLPANNLLLSLFRDDGSPLTVSGNLGSGSSFAFNVPGGATQGITAASTGGVQPGYAVLRAPLGTSVRATMIVRLEQNAQVLTQLGVAQQFPGSSFSFAAQVDLQKGINTGLALANPILDPLSAGAQDLVIQLLNPSGSLGSTAVLRLNPGAHTSLFLSDPKLFPGLDKFQGTVSVSAASQFSVIGLRLDRGVLAALEITPGVILAPFLLFSGAAAETEPNGSNAQAQNLTPPALVTGAFTPAGDVDLFRFTAKKGDIVTVVIESASRGSKATVVVTLEASNGSTLSQSTTLGTGDPFVQAVLPADGTYFLRLREFSSLGGSEFTYRLHLNVKAP